MSPAAIDKAPPICAAFFAEHIFTIFEQISKAAEAEFECKNFLLDFIKR